MGLTVAEAFKPQDFRKCCHAYLLEAISKIVAYAQEQGKSRRKSRCSQHTHSM